MDGLEGVGKGSARAPNAHLLRLELRLAPNPRVQFSVLHQWNSAQGAAAWNARPVW